MFPVSLSFATENPFSRHEPSTELIHPSLLSKYQSLAFSSNNLTLLLFPLPHSVCAPWLVLPGDGRYLLVRPL